MADSRDYDPFDALSEGQREEADERKRLRRESENDDFCELMKLPHGRRFLWRLLANTGVFQISFRGDNATEFREGQRNVGLKYLTMLHELCPDGYVTMLQEQRDEDQV